MANNILLFNHLKENEKLNHYFIVKKHEEYIEIIPSSEYKNTFRTLQLYVMLGDLFDDEIYIKCTSVKTRWRMFMLGVNKNFTLSGLDQFIEKKLAMLPSFVSKEDMISIDIIPEDSDQSPPFSLSLSCT